MVPIPTARLLGAALAGGLLVAAATIEPAALYVAAAFLLGVTALAAQDFRLLPPASALEVVRRCEARLSLGEPNPVELFVRWHGANGDRDGGHLRLWARDESPEGIAIDRVILDGTIAPGGEWTGRYLLSPNRRGDYRFGAAHLRLRGPLGLTIRQYSFPLAEAVRVYPSVQAVQRLDLMARRGRLQEMGLHHARLFGAGTEFERLRDYQPDDDYRRIAWKATARKRRPVTVEYETERSQNLIILLDTGRLMATPVGEMEKLDYAVNTALMLAYTAVGLEDRVGLLAYSDQPEVYLPPRRGRGQFHLLLESMYGVNTQPVESDHGRALAYLASRQPRRSLVVMFTDLEDASGAAGLAASLGVLSRHHLPLCVTISDPTIGALADAAPNDSRAAYEKVVARRLLEERRAVLETLARRGALTLDVPAEKLTVDVVNRYLEIKARTRL